MSKFIRSFTVMPKEMFRMNYGTTVALRDRNVKLTGSHDLLTEAGIVKPKALDPPTYRAPNGASMRPNTATLHRLVKTDTWSRMLIFAIPQGTRIPGDLILVHERTDHYSLQPTTEMTLHELNTKLTDFMNVAGLCFTKVEWLQRYPKPTERF